MGDSPTNDDLLGMLQEIALRKEKDDERAMTSRELAEQLGCHPGTVREKMRVLIGQGLVEVVRVARSSLLTDHYQRVLAYRATTGGDVADLAGGDGG